LWKTCQASSRLTKVTILDTKALPRQNTRPNLAANPSGLGILTIRGENEILPESDPENGRHSAAFGFYADGF
jgi:hypothetical protein